MIDREKVINGLECCLANGHNNCPYESTDEGIDKVTSCTTYLMRDALALLKAQQPRVMTLEEAQSTDYVWYEVRSTGLVYPVSVSKSLNTLDGYYAADVQQIGCGVSKFIPEKEYGKTWRCWTSRPTTEQREAEKWDG